MPKQRRRSPLLLAAGLAARAAFPGVTAAAAAAAGPLVREPAASLRLPPVPPAFAFTVENALAPLTFDQPVAVVAPPGETNRLFVVEKPGRIIVIPDLAHPSAATFLDLTAKVGDASGEQGLLALAFHPDFAANGYFYIYHTLSTTTAAGTGRHDRLARYRVSPANPNAADPASEFPLITQRDEAGNHNGGQLLFGPDGYLYLSLGDEGGANDTYGNGQRIDRDFFACVLRIDVDRRPGSLEPNPHAAVHPGAYGIPPDNPFIGVTAFSGRTFPASSVRTEIWTAGLRNPWRMSLDPATGRIWVGDVGQGAREEIDILVPGGNYGWPHREGFIAGPGGPPPPGTPFIDPIHDYPRSQGFSVTGGLVYRGSAVSQLYGAYVFADYGTGRIWSLRENPPGPPTVEQLAADAGIASFGVHPGTGEILLANINQGRIRRLAYNGAPAGTPFPALLSETGAFASLDTLAPAPGIVAYEPNVAFWSDHARKRRWFGLPEPAGHFGFSAEGPWTLPAGATWVKHFDLELERGNPATARRVETRFLVRTSTGVYGITYRWNEAQTDAVLVPEEGAEEVFTVVENGSARNQTWRFPGRGECLACHTPQGGYALSFNTRQLDRDHAYPGGKANQLEALAGAGYLAAPLPPPSALPALAAADDLTATLQHRVRSYLDVNCAPCHQPAGPAPGSWDARFSQPLSLAGIVDGPLLDDGGDAANRVIAPGDPAHSRLLQRLRGLTAARMPPVATNERDLAAEALLEAWIASLAAPDPPPRLINLSGRGRAGTGAEVLIPSFVIEGSAPRTVLVRAAGPALAAFGVGGVLAEPVLTLFSGQQVIASNTRWNSDPDAGAIRAAAAQVGAFPLPEEGADSALLVTLGPGGYTAQASGRGETTGEALVEVYDAEPGATGSRLVNTAIRTRLAGAGDVFIPGLVVQTGAPVHVLVRAVGPGLAAFGVADPLPRPALRLFAGSELLASNAGWSSGPNPATLRNAAVVVGAFALAEGSADAAALLHVPPGAYTLHISSANEAGGTVLAEVYEVP